ncbi:hypothetical protein O3G_MSEX011234 [Manduca sexta]|uniref:Uncharacterized protein n=1 Tax=Manduca sexta TaxID=7130 RepID=A0A922CV08_MANSE|nr:hypothetical protein O3G_MSEX011234 [Manduca sexta]
MLNITSDRILIQIGLRVNNFAVPNTEVCHIADTLRSKTIMFNYTSPYYAFTSTRRFPPDVGSNRAQVFARTTPQHIYNSMAWQKATTCNATTASIEHYAKVQSPQAGKF